MANAGGASEKIKRLREELLGDENVLLAYAFGSYARGFITPLSDVDVAVLLKDNSLGKLSELWSRLAKALKISEGLIDIVDLARAPLRLKYNIVKHGFKLIDRGSFGERLREDILSRPREQVAASRLHRLSMERYVHAAIEAMLDACRHIFSQEVGGPGDVQGPR